MYTINKEETALTLQECIAKIAALEIDQITALEKVSETEAPHYSDGSELIPVEVQAKMRRNGGQLLDVPLVAGYTVDREGLTNAYTIEPAMYFAESPVPEQQRRYALQGAMAALLVTLSVFTAFAIS